MNRRTSSLEQQKEEGRGLLLRMDVLKRYFGITARQIYKRAGINNEPYANDVLHGRQISKPALGKIESAISYFSHSKKFKSFFLDSQFKKTQKIFRSDERF